MHRRLPGGSRGIQRWWQTRNRQEKFLMIAGYHLVWTAYGTWLPNDPRGSSSHEIRSPILEELGELHHGRKTIHPASSAIRKFYQASKPLLKHDILTFSDDDIALLAESFAETITKRRYTCYGCAIMQDH